MTPSTGNTSCCDFCLLFFFPLLFCVGMAKTSRFGGSNRYFFFLFVCSINIALLVLSCAKYCARHERYGRLEMVRALTPLIILEDLLLKRREPLRSKITSCRSSVLG